MSKTICQITWTEQDMMDAFASEYNREPTSKELTDCLKRFSVKQMVDGSTEFGWSFIYDAVRNFMKEGGGNVICEK